MFDTKNLPLTISSIIVISLIIGWGISMVLAWEPPAASPPDGNVAAPINVSGTAQTKSGDLNIGGGLNYWITKDGDSFALKNNAGTIQFIVGQNGKVGIGDRAADYTLSVDGTVSVSGDFYSGLANCNGNSTIDTDISGKLVCGTDDTGTGITCDDCNAQFVNISGDTMTDGLGMANNNIDTVNHIYINDPGPTEGISWNGTTAGWKIDVSPIGRTDADGDLNLYGIANNIHLWRPTQIDGNLIVGGDIYATNLGSDVTPIGKLTVTTIDPVYEIDGRKYATYVADFAGGVRMETSGVIQLNFEAKYVIDFDNLEKGTDLWLFWETSNKEMDDLAVVISAGFDGKVWYNKDGNKLIIYGDEPGEVSYRLTLPRLDDEEWGNLVED